MKRRRSLFDSDMFAVVVGVLFLVLLVASIILSVWARFMAPCGDISWLPIHELPGRCLTLVRQ